MADKEKQLKIIYETFAKILSKQLSILLRTETIAELLSIEEKTQNDFIESISTPSIISIVEINNEIEQKIIITIDNIFMLSIFSSLLGGSVEKKSEAHKLTLIETAIVETFMKRICSCLDEAWPLKYNVNHNFELLEQNPKFLTVNDSEDKVYIVKIKLMVSDIEGSFLISIPYNLVDFIYSDYKKNNTPASNPAAKQLEIILDKIEKLEWVVKSQHLNKSNVYFYRPFRWLSRVDPSHLLNFLGHGENLQAIAVVMSYSDPLKAGSVISCLDEDFQAEIIERIACLDRIEYDLLESLEEIVRQNIVKLAAEDFTSAGGVDDVVEILKNVTIQPERKILSDLKVRDPELFDVIRYRFIIFEDIFDLNPFSLEILLNEIKFEDLALALSVCDEISVNKFYSKLSVENRNQLKIVSNQPLSENARMIDQAQDRIANIMRYLKEQAEENKYK